MRSAERNDSTADGSAVEPGMVAARTGEPAAARGFVAAQTVTFSEVPWLLSYVERTAADGFCPLAV